MAVIGLTKSLSLMAGEAAALGAGAKVVANYMGNLTEEDMRELEKSNAEILLFGGGYEHVNRTMVLHNAKLIAESDIRIPMDGHRAGALLQGLHRLFGVESHRTCAA